MTFRASRRLLALLAAVALGTGTLAVAQTGPGRFFAAVVAVGTAVEAVRGLVPTLVADADGLTVTHGLRRVHLAWADVHRIGSLEGQAVRRRANALEIDLGERLLVVPRYRLGAPVPDVVSALSSIRGGAGGC